VQLIYDNQADALAVRITDHASSRTVEMEPGTLVDVAADGSVVTIEVIQPARRWALEEILTRFAVTEDDEAMLRALWEGDTTLELSRPAPLAVA
jgi:uncharacterized protein YuzE